MPAIPGFPVPLPSARIIQRPQLFERLDKGTIGLLTAVIGPTGTGKTDLLISWLHQAGTQGPVRWLEAPSTSDPEVFWSGVRDAAAGNPGVPALDALQDLDSPVTVVIDDIHRFTGELSTPLTRLSRRTSHLRIVAAGRDPLGAEFLQLRLAGQLFEIDAAELSFTESETLRLAALDGTDISRADASRLHRAAGGWAAALRFALQRRAHGEQFPAALDSYVRTGILPTIDAEDRRLLRRTALFDEFTAETVAALVGGNVTDDRLRRLHAAGLLAGSPAAEYRPHPLLRNVLTGDQPPAEQAEIRRRLAGYFRDRDPARSLRYARRAGDTALIRTLCRDHSAELPAAEVREVFADIPPEQWRSDPELLLAIAAAYRRSPGYEHSAATLTDAAQDAARHCPRPGLRTAALLATARQFTRLYSGDHGEALAAREELSARLRETEAGSVLENAHALASFHAAAGLDEAVLGHAAAASRQFEAARTAAAMGDNPAAAGLSTAGQLLLDALAGRANDVHSRLSTVDDSDDEALACAQLAAGLAAVDRREPGQALANFDGAAVRGQLRLLHASGVASALQDTGEPERALDLVREVLGRCDRSMCSPFAIALLARVQAELLIHVERPDAAAATLDLVDTAEEGPAGIAATRARIALSTGNPAQAADILQYWLAGRPARAAGMLVDALATHAVAAMLCGRTAEAVRSYRQATVTAQRTGCRRPLALVPRPLVPLLEGSGPRTGHAHLTPRERVVLGYLGRDATIREIAGQLSVSQNTLKTQLRCLYRKLEARSRTEALDRARSLNLL